MHRLILLAWIMIFPGHVAAESISLASHNEIEIKARPKAIWPFIVDTSTWKAATQSTLIAGRRGDIGEVLRINGSSSEGKYAFQTEVIVLEKLKRKVIRIYGLDDNPTAFGAWILYPRGDTTLLSYEVFAEYPMPGVAVEQLKAISQQVNTTNRDRYQIELEQLKRLVEDESE